VDSWAPATEAEAAMRDVLRAGDQEHYFRILARLDLLLPVSADSAGRRSPGWGTWSSDGRKIIDSSNLDRQSRGLSIYFFETGRLEQISDFSSPSMALLQDDRRGLFSLDGTIFIADTATLKRRSLFSVAPDKIIRFRLSRDNRWLYYILESTEADIWLLNHK